MASLLNDNDDAKISTAMGNSEDIFYANEEQRRKINNNLERTNSKYNTKDGRKKFFSTEIA
uniref:Uncharacterized protein n=1 Tax=Romanomermis culicivorax TaxID=13658 RepID=A0A915HTS2_ROMCU